MIYGLAVVVMLGTILVAWYAMKYHWWGPVIDERHPRILFYHMISKWQPGMKFKGLRVSPEAFEQQIRYLAENDWHFILMSELMREDLPPRSVAITFDDGYLDNLTQAMPVLEKYNACATLYLVEDRHDRDWSVAKKAHHDSGELMREPKLTDEDVQTLLASGRWELGCHTRSHCNLSTTSAAEKEDEVASSRQRLAEQFNTEISSFAYPFGIYSQEDVDLVRKAGFSTAVTTIEGIDTFPDLMQLKRVKVSGKDSDHGFRKKLMYGKQGYKV